MEDFIVVEYGVGKGKFLVAPTRELKEIRKRNVVSLKRIKDVRGLYQLLVGDKKDFSNDLPRVTINSNKKDYRYFLHQEVREALKRYQPLRKRELEDNSRIAKEKGLYGRVKSKSITN